LKYPSIKDTVTTIAQVGKKGFIPNNKDKPTPAKAICESPLQKKDIFLRTTTTPIRAKDIPTIILPIKELSMNG
jgi:hypothetical protein